MEQRRILRPVAGGRRRGYHGAVRPHAIPVAPVAPVAGTAAVVPGPNFEGSFVSVSDGGRTVHQFSGRGGVAAGKKLFQYFLVNVDFPEIVVT